VVLVSLAIEPEAVVSRPTTGSVAALDGDTLRLADGQRLRLAGVDCPEYGRPLADQATSAAAAFVATGTVTLEPADPPTDRYGRLLADVRVGGESLAEHLAERGLAWVYRSRDERLLDSQRRAVEHRRGVHFGLDAWDAGAVVITASGFHRAGCRLTGPRGVMRPQAGHPEAAFKRGLAPCRRCLPWPPLSWPQPR